MNAWLGALVLVLPQVATSLEGGALSAYSDLPLAAFIACAVFELAGDEPDPLRTGLWLSFIALTKNEGLPFAFVLLAISAFVFRKRALITAIPLTIATAALLVWRSGIDPTDEAKFSPAVFTADRASEALLAFAKHAADFRAWGILWIATPIAAAVLIARKQWRPLAVAAAAVVPMLAIYLIMYAMSNWNPADLVNSTAPRLLTHFLGPALLLLGHATHAND